MKKHSAWLLGILVILVVGIFLAQNPEMLSASVFKEPSDRIVLQTNMGDIEIRLLPEHAPDIAENFRLLAQDNYYDGVPFHRIIKGFMIQSGDFENFDGTGGHAYGGGLLEDEFSPQLSHVRGAVSMANRGPNTNGSQFFIVQKDAPFLDGKHSIFGQVVNGMDTVDRIANVKTDLNDAPLETVEIKNVLVP